MHNKTIDVTKIFTFDSAHKLDNYEGDCKYLHGHTYKLEVTLRGKVDYRGMVMDFNDLKAIVNEKVLDRLDHRYLNDIFEFNTTCENMLVWIFQQLDEAISGEGVKLQKLVLWETPNSFGTLEREHYYAEN